MRFFYGNVAPDHSREIPERSIVNFEQYGRTLWATSPQRITFPFHQFSYGKSFFFELPPGFSGFERSQRPPPYFLSSPASTKIFKRHLRGTLSHLHRCCTLYGIAAHPAEYSWLRYKCVPISRVQLNAIAAIGGGNVGHTAPRKSVLNKLARRTHE